MAIEHALLTGIQLHEPKGIATAPNGSVYESNGSGSGAWLIPTRSLLNQNQHIWMNKIADVGSTESVYFYIPFACSMTHLRSIIYGTLSTTDAILTVYINGVLFADSLTLPFSGSGAGQVYSANIVTVNALSAGDIITVTSDGGPANSVKADVYLQVEAS